MIRREHQELLFDKMTWGDKILMELHETPPVGSEGMEAGQMKKSC